MNPDEKHTTHASPATMHLSATRPVDANKTPARSSSFDDVLMEGAAHALLEASAAA
jgi:hypothetical protein